MPDGPSQTNREPGLKCAGCEWHRWLSCEGVAVSHHCEHPRFESKQSIGLDPATPVWCPVLKQKEKQS